MGLSSFSSEPLAESTYNVGTRSEHGAHVLLQKLEHKEVRKPRLAQFRYELEIDSPDFEPDLSRIVHGYCTWRFYDEYLVFKRQHKYTGKIDFKAVLSSKRGNKVYAWRQRQRFKELNNIEDFVFFNYKDRSSRHRTRALFICLEFNPHEYTTAEAWQNVGKHWNSYLTGLRQKYGDVQFLRVWEAHKSAYPHIQGILLFAEQDFDAFFYNGVWRVQEKHEIVSAWSHGFTDIEALASVRGGVNYVIKYLNKVNSSGIDGSTLGASYEDNEFSMARLVSNASVLTLALLWVFRKRAYSVSKNFLDEITLMHNSKSRPIQVDLIHLKSVWEWVLMGFWGGSLGAWSVKLSYRDFRALKGSPTWTDNARLNLVKH